VISDNGTSMRRLFVVYRSHSNGAIESITMNKEDVGNKEQEQRFTLCLVALFLLKFF